MGNGMMRRSRCAYCCDETGAVSTYTDAVRRRDVVWWSLFGATVLGWLVVGVWVYLGSLTGRMFNLVLFLMAGWGLALHTARHIFGVRVTWPRRRPDGP